MALNIQGLFNPTSISVPTSHLAQIQDGGEEPTDSFTVTKNLSHCAISNEVVGEASYYAEIAPTGGWSDLQVTIKVGGVDMSEYYSSGVINIPNVTGNIVITATAAAAPLTSITAVYTQSGTVYDTDSLDSLKSDLVVTAYYDNGTSATVTTYTLSGTLTEGTSTITVSYGGKTTSFNVTVTEAIVADGVYTPNEVVRGSYIDSNGDIQTVTNNSGYIADYIPLSTYSFEIIYTNAPANIDYVNWRMSEYDENKTFIQQTQFHDDTATKKKIIPLNQSTRYIRLGWYNDSDTFVPVFSFTRLTSMPMEIGALNASTGEEEASTSRLRSDFIEATGTISFSGSPFADAWETNGGYAFRCYDSNKSFVGSATNNGGLWNSDISNVSLPSDTAYVRIFLNRKGNYTFTSGWGATAINPVVLNGTAYKLTEV